MIKKILLYFRWKFFDYSPYSCTFKVYLDKLKIDEERKKAGQPPLKDRIKDYRKAQKKKHIHEYLPAEIYDKKRKYIRSTEKCDICQKERERKPVYMGKFKK